MTSEEAIQPLGRAKQLTKIRCSNPHCNDVFEIDIPRELMKPKDGLFECPKCGKRYYVLVKQERVWVRAISEKLKKIPSKMPKKI